MRSRVEAAVI